MTRLLFVGDGPRDAATNPHLVRSLAGLDFDSVTIAWHEVRLHGVKGYDRKLLYLLRRERSSNGGGVVATVDRDRSRGRERLGSLRHARDRDRDTAAPLPCAIGCADPHGEAWMLDDPVAVRTGLRLDPAAPIPTVTKVASPKDAFVELHRQSNRSGDDINEVLGDIAKAVDVRRSAHARATGLEDFIASLSTEILPLFRAK